MLFKPMETNPPLPWGMWTHLIHPSLYWTHSPPQTASGSNQPFCHNTLSGQTNQPTDQPTDGIGNNSIPKLFILYYIDREWRADNVIQIRYEMPSSSHWCYKYHVHINFQCHKKHDKNKIILLKGKQKLQKDRTKYMFWSLQQIQHFK